MAQERKLERVRKVGYLSFITISIILITLTIIIVLLLLGYLFGFDTSKYLGPIL